MILFKKKQPARLRWYLFRTLIITFTMLWIATMLLFTKTTYDQIQLNLESAARSVKTAAEDYYNEFYTKNTSEIPVYAADDTNETTDEAYISLQNYLSYLSIGEFSESDGGAAIAVCTGSKTARSQIAWGYGNTEGMDRGQTWYLSFDDGLDDAGQIQLAEWIIANRNSWSYMLYSENDGDGSAGKPGDIARITGTECSGHEIKVQKIEIVHSDGSADIMVETSLTGLCQTWDFAYVDIRSLLLPSWNSSGTHEHINMEKRLAAYQKANALLDREISDNNNSVSKYYIETSSKLTSNEFVIGSRDSSGVFQCIAVKCNVLYAAVSQNIGLYISSGLLTLAVMLLLSGRLSKRVTIPVEMLCSDVKTGKRSVSLPVHELNILSSAFSEAQEKLEDQLNREREFTRSAAHELKTPLAVLRAHAECARENIAPDKRSAYLDIVLEESDLMSGLVNSLLDLARLESAPALKMENIRLDLLIRSVLDHMALDIENKQIILSMSLDEISIFADKNNLYKIVENLASNAVRHTPPGGTVTVSLCRRSVNGQENAVLTVDNDGACIPEQDLPKLWEPFFRVDKARSRADGGSGLGLAIARAAVLALGGTCEAANRTEGVFFTVTLPAGSED